MLNMSRRSGGGGPRHTDKKVDICIVQLILQKGSNGLFQEKIYFTRFEGAGSNTFQGKFIFFQEGVGSVCLILWKPVELVLTQMRKSVRLCIKSGMSTSSKCSHVAKALARLL